MGLIVATVILQLVASVLSTNVTEDANINKTKRTVAPQAHNYGENRPVLFYPENQPNFYQNPEVPKQVAAQQVLYEFEQTPTNAVSNVHVNQVYQPLSHQKQENHFENPQYISSSETVATPVQHSSVVRHGQNYAQVQLPYPHHIQTHQFIPGKYLYVNGKIVYQPNQHQYQNIQKPVNYYNNPPITHKLPFVRPMAYRRFQPPQPNQFQKITKPMYAPEVEEHQEKPVQEEEEEEEENAPVRDENEDEDKSSYEDDDFGKYRFDEDEDHDSYREDDDEDDDNERRSSKSIPKKHSPQKKPYKYAKNYKFSEKYSSKSKYAKPMKKGRKTTKKPRRERYEGKQSQQVPVVHKQKIFKEKWYVTKSADDDSIFQ